MSFTNGGVGCHIVTIVETDKGKVGHVWGEGQDQEDSHDARHGRSPQTHGSEREELADPITRHQVGENLNFFSETFIPLNTH